MNVRKHVDGFAVFLIILSIAVSINEYLTFPNFKVLPVRIAAPHPQPKINGPQQPVTFKVRQVSLDYNSRKSYTELNLFRPLDQPAPDKVWVTTTFFSPDSTRAEDWTVTTEFHQPFDKGNGEVFVATEHWDLPPLLDKPGAGYFARVEVSSEYQGKVYEPEYSYSSDPRNAMPVVIHWPDEDVLARDSKKLAR